MQEGLLFNGIQGGVRRQVASKKIGRFFDLKSYAVIPAKVTLSDVATSLRLGKGTGKI